MHLYKLIFLNASSYGSYSTKRIEELKVYVIDDGNVYHNAAQSLDHIYLYPSIASKNRKGKYYH